VLAVLGVVPGEGPESLGVKLRSDLDRRLVHAQHVGREIEVFGDERDQLAVADAGRHPEPAERLGCRARQNLVHALELARSRDHNRLGRRVLKADALDRVVRAVPMIAAEGDPRPLHRRGSLTAGGIMHAATPAARSRTTSPSPPGRLRSHDPYQCLHGRAAQLMLFRLFEHERSRKALGSGGPGEFHWAPTDPGVTVSRHQALLALACAAG
jgi:hypothetical protein